MARTDNLTNFLTDIATAIKTKKGTSAAIPASNFDTEIASIETAKPIKLEDKQVSITMNETRRIVANSLYDGLSSVTVEVLVPEGVSKYSPKWISFANYTDSWLTEETANLDTSKLTTMSSMFNGCTKLYGLDLSTWNTSKVVDMSGMFYNCQNIRDYLYVTNFNTSKVTNMSSMFSNCMTVRSLDLGSFDTSNVTNMSYMFNYCERLNSLNISSFNTSKVTTFESMFSKCRGITTLDLSHFDSSKCTNFKEMFRDATNLQRIVWPNAVSTAATSSSAINYMFIYMYNLRHLDMRSFDFTKFSASNMFMKDVPTDCEIIVADDGQRNWFLQCNSAFTNIKTVAELEAAE